MNGNPLVTVNILSFNRRDELQNTLTKVYEQDYKNIEIIVVDNASSDGSAEMVKTDFPDVQLIQLNKNIGIAGWNEGFKVAKGEYVLVLDDDSYPDRSSIKKGIQYFHENNHLGIVAFHIFNIRINKSETIDFNTKPNFFVGCGALIGKIVLNKIGYYNEQYFLYLHELDYSARCYDAGIEIIYLSTVFIFHNQSILSRGKKTEDPFYSEYRFRYYFISYSIFLIQRFDFIHTMKYLLKWILNRTIVCLKYSFFRGYLQSVLYLIKHILTIVKNRKILSVSVQKFYNYGNISLIDKDFL